MGCGFSITQNSVKTQISIFAPSLSSAEKKAADFIIANPTRVVDINVSEMAELSGVSEATVIRLCKHLEYSGFYQMKLQLSHDIGRQQCNAPNGADAYAFQEKLTYISNRLLSIGQRLNPETVKQCASVIRNCSMVHVIGCGQSRILVSDMVYRLAGYGIRAVGGGAYETEIANLMLAPKDDILICISKSGETDRVLKAVEIANEHGMATVAITGAEGSTLASKAMYILCAGMFRGDDSDTNIYLMSVLETLFACLNRSGLDGSV